MISSLVDLCLINIYLNNNLDRFKEEFGKNNIYNINSCFNKSKKLNKLKYNKLAYIAIENNKIDIFNKLIPLIPIDLVLFYSAKFDKLKYFKYAIENGASNLNDGITITIVNNSNNIGDYIIKNYSNYFNLDEYCYIKLKKCIKSNNNDFFIKLNNLQNGKQLNLYNNGLVYHIIRNNNIYLLNYIYDNYFNIAFSDLSKLIYVLIFGIQSYNKDILDLLKEKQFFYNTSNQESLTLKEWYDIKLYFNNTNYPLLNYAKEIGILEN